VCEELIWTVTDVNHLPNLPWIDSPLFESQLAKSGASEERKQQARTFHRDGFVILDDAIPMELVDSIVGQYPHLFDPEARFPDRKEKPPMLTFDPGRRQDAWAVSPEVLELACLDEIIDLLRFLYRREPIPFQTLNFLPGTQQTTHSDSIHFDSRPNGFMCDVWVALEDVTLDNGPLAYYPGSHRLPRIQIEHLGLWAPGGNLADGPEYGRYEAYVHAAIEAGGFERKTLEVKKGTALVWSSNLLHGGAKVLNQSATRMSQVTHYFFEDCLYYSPILSNVSLGEFAWKQIFNLRADVYVEQTINGQHMEVHPMPDGRVRFAREASLPEHWTSANR